MTGDNFDRANRLRPRLLRGVERILCARGARLNLRHIKIACEALLLLHIREF